MSATELAVVVEGWATLAGLLVVITGAVFAGVQLRQEAKARKLQALMAVLTNIRPPEVTKAWPIMRALPDGFDPQTLTHDEQEAVLLVFASFGRLGTLLAAGAVDEKDIFPHLTFSKGAIDAWEKMKHLAGGDGASFSGALNPTVYQELLAIRAQAYLLREGAERFGSIPQFTPDWPALNALGEQIATARAAAA